MTTKSLFSFNSVLFTDDTEETLTTNCILSTFQALLNELWHYNPRNQQVTIFSQLPLDYVVGRINRLLEELEGESNICRARIAVLKVIESGNLLCDENKILMLKE
jgi:hypothetical protein